MKKAAALLVLIALLFSLAACTPSEKTAQGFSMGSDYYVTYTFDGDLDAEIASLLSHVEETYSARVDTSLIARLNAAPAGASLSLSEEELQVLSDIFFLAETSDGAFNPAVLPLVKAWGFDPPYEMNGEVPPAAEAILGAKEKSALSLFALDKAGKCIRKTDAAAALDLGGAMKGYAVDLVAENLRTKHVQDALVYLGGTIAAVGRDYEIGVTPPRDSEASFAFRFTLSDGEKCATSGDYERYYEYAGKRYHHILDSETGYPASSGVISATVVSSNGMFADAFATAVVVLGVEKGVALLEKCGLKGAIVTEEKKVVTVGLSVTIKDKSYEIA